MKKILLLHGWNYRNYSHLIDKSAWHNREDFISKLKDNYEIYYPDMPGFGTEPVPNNSDGWNLDDYALYVKNYIESNKLDIEYIIGYSFGGAVAIDYKEKFDNDAKLILISPAIIRNASKSKKFTKTPKYLSRIRNYLRDLYLIYKVKTPEMVNGNKFLRNTYQSIVREELIDIVEKFSPEDFIIIYGSLDNMVNPLKVYSIFNDNVRMIEGGGHDIANSHSDEIISLIEEFINNKVV